VQVHQHAGRPLAVQGIEELGAAGEHVAHCCPAAMRSSFLRTTADQIHCLPGPWPASTGDEEQFGCSPFHCRIPAVRGGVAHPPQRPGVPRRGPKRRGLFAGPTTPSDRPVQSVRG
jgi:hypothetical protein